MSKFLGNYISILFILFKILINLEGMCSIPADETFLIAGGYKPIQHSIAKYVASIRLKRPKTFFGVDHYCSGVIIGKKYILTAAHCVSAVKPDNLVVVIGSTKRLSNAPNGQILNVGKVHVHPEFAASSNELLNYDVAVLQVTQPIQVDDIDVDIAKISGSSKSEGTKCTLAGWGILYQNGPMPNEIIYADVTITNKKQCGKVYPESNQHFCAGFNNNRKSESNSCYGDSGAPLFCNGEVTGILSYGGKCGESVGAIYADVAFHKNFIGAFTENAQT